MAEALRVFVPFAADPEEERAERHEPRIREPEDKTQAHADAGDWPLSFGSLIQDFEDDTEDRADQSGDLRGWMERVQALREDLSDALPDVRARERHRIGSESRDV